MSLLKYRTIQFPFLLLLVTTLGLHGCAGGYALARHDLPGPPDLSWFSPVAPADRVHLARWSPAVGPPVLRAAPPGLPASDTLRVVSWNVAVGAGDMLKLINELREADARSPFVLLLQEVYRGGPEVPHDLDPRLRFPGRLGAPGPHGRRDDVSSVAAAAGLHLYYVPSMRNGGPAASDEDRGNAILSSLPLSRFTAIELPFERQRRVAVAANVSGISSAGQEWTVRLMSAHLDNMVGPRRLFFAGGEFARARQARALIESLRDEETVVLGGDFNTWFGFQEKAYIETAQAFGDTMVLDRRPTFAGLLRLDHLFFRLPDGWTSAFERGSHKYGSDHYPLVATIRIPQSSPAKADTTASVH